MVSSRSGIASLVSTLFVFLVMSPVVDAMWNMHSRKSSYNQVFTGTNSMPRDEMNKNSQSQSGPGGSRLMPGDSMDDPQHSQIITKPSKDCDNDYKPYLRCVVEEISRNFRFPPIPSDESNKFKRAHWFLKQLLYNVQSDVMMCNANDKLPASIRELSGRFRSSAGHPASKHLSQSLIERCKSAIEDQLTKKCEAQARQPLMVSLSVIGTAQMVICSGKIDYHKLNN